MTNQLILFLVPFIVGMCMFFTKPIADSKLKFLLNFSGAFLFGIIIFHLLPDIYIHSSDIHSSDSKIIGLFVVIGVVIQSSLELLSKGIEHGYSHCHTEKGRNIKIVTISTFLSICIHSLIEGMPLHEDHSCLHHRYDHHTHSLLSGIILHKIPVVIILTSLFLKSFSKFKTLLFIFIFCLMSPLGSILGGIGFFLNYHTYVTAVATGVIIHVSTFMIYEDNHSHYLKIKKIATIIIGFIVAYITV